MTTSPKSIQLSTWALAGMGTCPPPWKCWKVFLLQMLSKTPVDEVFMHHFKNMSSASGGPSGELPPGPCWGTSVLHTSLSPHCPPLEKILREPMVIKFYIRLSTGNRGKCPRGIVPREGTGEFFYTPLRCRCHADRHRYWQTALLNQQSTLLNSFIHSSDRASSSSIRVDFGRWYK